MELNNMALKNPLTPDFILNYLLKSFHGLKIINAWGEISVFYNPDNLLKRGIYFCTLKEKDGENDRASNLNRIGIFRMNFGVSKNAFQDIFQAVPKRPTKGNFIEGKYDFQALDTLTPHPVYGWMAWVSILNPSIQSLEELKIIIEESYRICIEKYKKKLAISKSAQEKKLNL